MCKFLFISVHIFLPMPIILTIRYAIRKCVEDKYSRCHKNAYELSLEILNERVVCPYVSSPGTV